VTAALAKELLKLSSHHGSATPFGMVQSAGPKSSNKLTAVVRVLTDMAGQIIEMGRCQATTAGTLAEMSKNIEVLLEGKDKRQPNPDGAEPPPASVDTMGVAPPARTAPVAANSSSDGRRAQVAEGPQSSQYRVHPVRDEVVAPVGGIFS